MSIIHGIQSIVAITEKVVFFFVEPKLKKLFHQFLNINIGHYIEVKDL